MWTDTCAAFATAPGTAGLAVLRISGPEAGLCSDKVFLPGPARLQEEALSLLAQNTFVSQMPGYTCRFGHLYHPQNGVLIDEVVVTHFVAPHSYTGEEVVEFSIHGGTAVQAAVLEAMISAGAQPAEAGAFTKRAFLHGKLDLLQAEAVMDLIHAEAQEQASQALAQLSGSLSQKIAEIRRPLLDTRAHLELALQYPEHEESWLRAADLAQTVGQALEASQALISTYQNGRMIREGLVVALAGPTNAGKSTLLNLLSGYDRAIVTDIPGTTRDTLEERIRLEGYLVHLVDTAGLRETVDVVEQLGVQRSRKACLGADLVLWCLPLHAEAAQDGEAWWVSVGEESVREWRLLHEAVPGLPILPLLTQIDRVAQSDLRGLLRQVQDHLTLIREEHPSLLEPLAVSAYMGETQEQLVQRILEQIRGQDHRREKAACLTNQRQLQVLRQVEEILLLVNQGLYDKIPLDVVSLLLEQAAEQLAELTGESATESLWEEIFSRFCVGK